MKQFPLILIVLIVFVSCGRNRMKTDEKTLAKQILTEEEQLAKEEADRAVKEKQWADSIAKLPKGFRFKEDRKVDPQNLPQVIDIAGSIEKMKDIKLSAVAYNIQYIRMEAIPDSVRSQGMRFKYYLMDHYIVGLNVFGIHLFSKEGKYIRTVVKNEFTGVTYDKNENCIRILLDDYTMIGGGTSVWARGNSLFYRYTNSIKGEQYIMECDCSQEQPLTTKAVFDSEIKKGIIGLGKVNVDLNHGKTFAPAPRKNLYSYSYSASPEFIYLSLGTFAPDRNTYVLGLGGKHMLGVFSTNGDTLATFTKNEQAKKFALSTTRGTDRGNQYEKGGSLFIRTDFNDTIFQVIPPNKLLPVYVLNLGSYKVTKEEGVNPKFDLTGKIIPQDFADTKDYLFFTFTRDSYDCFNTRKNKTLKLYHGLYSKRTKETFIVKSDPVDYEAPMLMNDIDGGPSVWPTAYMIGKNGEILVPLTGTELKACVQFDSYQSSTANADKKAQLKQMVSAMANNDNILMIVK
jgi:hypothetical protein